MLGCSLSKIRSHYPNYLNLKLKRQRTFHHLLFAAIRNDHASSYTHLPRLDGISRVRSAFIQKGCWAEKEPMDLYLKKALEIGLRFLSTVHLTAAEEEQFTHLKRWYLNEYVAPQSTLIPFIKLEAIGKRFETAQSNYLKQKEVDFYLDQGFMGPLSTYTI